MLKRQYQQLLLPSSNGSWHSQDGWTLIELLTVVAIISLLSIGIMMIVSTQLGRARDATRIADLKDTQVYLEKYSIDHGARYPIYHNNATKAQNFLDMAAVLASQYNEYDGSTRDPKNLQYTYLSSGDGTTYCMCAEFERHGEKANSNSTCDFTVSEQDATHYCLVNKQ